MSLTSLRPILILGNRVSGIEVENLERGWNALTNNTKALRLPKNSRQPVREIIIQSKVFCEQQKLSEHGYFSPSIFHDDFDVQAMGLSL